MSALIPIKNDPAKNEVAMAGVRTDKQRDAVDGYDGGWVAHPGLVPIAMEHSSMCSAIGLTDRQEARRREGRRE